MPRLKFGKQISEQRLPSRYALNQITSGDPSARSLNNYAKMTPDMTSPDQESILTPPSARLTGSVDNGDGGNNAG